jgi:hypothetical protein
LKADKLHISLGNTKIGKRSTPNVSLLPIVTCPAGTPCAKRCYARRLCINKETIAAWLDNTAFALHDPIRFCAEVSGWIAKKKPAFFRWHVAGDIPSAEYQTGVLAVAAAHPATNFLIFTKRLDYSWKEKTSNLKVFLSRWPGDDWGHISTQQFCRVKGFSGTAWLAADSRAPRDGFHCKGSCEDCRACWDSNMSDLLLASH